MKDEIEVLRPIKVEKVEKLILKDCVVEINDVFRNAVETSPARFAVEINPDLCKASVVETREAVDT